MGWRSCLFRVLVLANLCSQVLTIGATCSKYGQFFGGSVSYTLEDAGGKFTVCFTPSPPTLEKTSLRCRPTAKHAYSCNLIIACSISKVYYRTLKTVDHTFAIFSQTVNAFEKLLAAFNVQLKIGMNQLFI